MSLIPLLMEAIKTTACVAGAVNAICNDNDNKKPAVVEVEKPVPVVHQQPIIPQHIPPVNLTVNVNIFKDGEKVENIPIPKIVSNGKDGIDIGVF